MANVVSVSAYQSRYSFYFFCNIFETNIRLELMCVSCDLDLVDGALQCSMRDVFVRLV